METHLSRHPQSKLDEHANAGLEDVLAINGDFPYVVKSPWLYEFIDGLLGRDDIEIDAVIIPIRDIVEAASSRVTIELRERLGGAGVQEEYTTWETWASTPGGVVYSLNPLDQARLLAMGFHRVVHALVKKDIPIIFLDFPRLIEDGEYLYKKLQRVIGGKVSPAAALDAHHATAQPGLIRTGAEISANKASSSLTIGENFPAFEMLDRAAIFRELRRTQALLKSNSEQLDVVRSRYEAERTGREQLRAKLVECESNEWGLVQKLQAMEREQSATSGKLAEAQDQVSRLRSANLDLTEQFTRCSGALNEVLSSKTWRATYPIRAIVGLLKRKHHR
ncbi:hypothetical protein WJ07_24615 [Burkholderia vietnamiensis]|nr:hypothetical protein WJ07_24615 [Burkholderia vietnamiensis]